jgi:hypothetical protein
MAAAVHPLHLVAGPSLWAVGFIALYGGLSVGCAVAPPDPAAGAGTWLNASLIAMTLGFVGVMLHGAYRCARLAARDLPRESSAALIAGVAAALYLVSALVTVAIALPVLVLPPCL